jgi:hypothetical protein
VRVLVFAGAPRRPLLVSDEVDTVQGTYNPLRRLRGSRGACVNCGYDLRGQPSFGCPECGLRRQGGLIACVPRGSLDADSSE